MKRNLAAIADEGTPALCDIAGLQHPPVPSVFFRIIKGTPGSNKVVRVAAGAGKKVHSEMVAVTQHNVVEGMVGTILESRPSSSIDAVDRITLIDHAQLVEETEQFALVWQKSPRPMYVPTINLDDMPDRSVYAMAVT